MRNRKEILRQKWLLKRSHRATVASVGVSRVAPRAGLHVDSPRAPSGGRDPGVAAPQVPREAPGRPSVHRRSASATVNGLAARALVMRQVHVAGDKPFVDYSGKKPRVADAATGEVTDVERFVAALGASRPHPCPGEV